MKSQQPLGSYGELDPYELLLEKSLSKNYLNLYNHKKTFLKKLKKNTQSQAFFKIDSSTLKDAHQKNLYQ